MTSKRITGIGIASIASTGAIALAGLGLASTAGATPTAASGAKIKKAEIRVRGGDDVRMKVKTSRGVDKVTFTYAGETYKARRSHESPNEWKRTVDRDGNASRLAFSVTACDGDDCVTKSYSGTGDRVRSGSDDSSSDDRSRSRSSDDGVNHDAGDDKGGERKSGSSGSGSSGSGSGSSGSSDDSSSHDSGDDNGGRHGGHGSND